MASNTNLYNDYNEALEPAAASQELAGYESGLQREQKEEQMLSDRFSKNIPETEW